MSTVTIKYKDKDLEVDTRIFGSLLTSASLYAYQEEKAETNKPIVWVDEDEDVRDQFESKLDTIRYFQSIHKLSMVIDTWLRDGRK